MFLLSLFQFLLLSACPALKVKLPLGTSVTPTSVLPLAQLKSLEPHGSKSLKQQFQHRELHRNPQNVPKNLHSCMFVPSLALRDHKPTLKWILSQSNWDKLIAMFVNFTRSCSGTSKFIPKELSTKAAAAPTTFKIQFEEKKMKIILHISSILLIMWKCGKAKTKNDPVKREKSFLLLSQNQPHKSFSELLESQRCVHPQS